MSQLIGQLIYTSFAGVGFTTLKSPEISPEVQQAFLQQIVYQYWDNYNPPDINYQAIYLHRISQNETLFGWLYNDGFDDFGRAHVPYFICYYYSGCLLSIENILSFLENGALTKPPRDTAFHHIPLINFNDYLTSQSMTQGLEISSKLQVNIYQLILERKLFQVFVDNLGQQKILSLESEKDKIITNKGKAVNCHQVIQPSSVTTLEKNPVIDYQQILLTKALSETTAGKGSQVLFIASPKTLVLGYAAGTFSLIILLVILFSVFQFLTPKITQLSNNSPISIPSQSPKNRIFSEIKVLTNHQDAVWSIIVDKTGKTLFSGSADKTIKIWDVNTGSLKDTLMGHQATIRSLALSPDENILYSGSSDGKIHLWNLLESHKNKTFSENYHPIWAMTITPDGKTLVTGHEDGKIRLWNTQTGRISNIIHGHDGRLFTVAISANGEYLATGGIDKKIKIWHLQTGQLIRIIHAHDDAVRSLDFTPCGTQLISGSWDKTIKVWNWQTGALQKTFTGHTARVVSVKVSKDGKNLISSSTDKSVKVWNLESGQLINTLSPHNDWVLDVISTTKAIISSSRDGSIKIENR